MSENTWERVEGETGEWYHRFSSYFLLMGPARTMQRAYNAFMAIENPGVEHNKVTIPSSWREESVTRDWFGRADAFDAKLFQEDGSVELARTQLKKAAFEATIALIEALTNPRYAVAAAKEILDRAGIPATQTHLIKTTPFTADEMAAASKELEAWEQNALNG